MIRVRKLRRQKDISQEKLKMLCKELEVLCSKFGPPQIFQRYEVTIEGTSDLILVKLPRLSLYPRTEISDGGFMCTDNFSRK